MSIEKQLKAELIEWQKLQKKEIYAKHTLKTRQLAAIYLQEKSIRFKQYTLPFALILTAITSCVYGINQHGPQALLLGAPITGQAYTSSLQFIADCKKKLLSLKDNEITIRNELLKLNKLKETLI